MPYFNNQAKVVGTWKPGVLTLWVDTEFTKNMLSKPTVTGPLAQAAQARFETPVRIELKVGKPTEQAQPQAAPAAQPAPAAPEQEDPMKELLAFGEQFDNIVIQ